MSETSECLCGRECSECLFSFKKRHQSPCRECCHSESTSTICHFEESENEEGELNE
jgi:hypothetical protein